MSADDPIFLKRSQVEELHDVSLERYGGQAGVREPGLVEYVRPGPRNEAVTSREWWPEENGRS